VTHDQQAAISRHWAECIERLRGVKAAPELRVHRQQRPLLHTPALSRKLRSLARAYAWAEQHGVKVPAQPLDRHARGARLLTPALGQAALSVRAGAMRLGLRVTK
jgi:hypothetical protein